MKILIVSFYYAPEVGAAPFRITNMAEGLQRNGMDIEVLTCLPNYPKGKIFDGYNRRFSKHETRNGIPLHRYWTYATVSKNPLLRLFGMLSFSTVLWWFGLHLRTIRRFDRVIIQTPPIMTACSAIVLFKKIYRKKVILNVSDLWPQSAIELGAVREGSLYHRVLLWMERFVYRNADAIQGQSRAILRHIEAFVPHVPTFLYRNLPPTPQTERPPVPRHAPFRIVYAGLLGVAQDLLSIVRNIDFRALDAELHLYGGGNQAVEIERHIAQHPSGVVCHGYLSKEKMSDELRLYDAAIVPLAVQIKGAVPSKIFDLISEGLPVLLCGGDEAADIVRDNAVGLVSAPRDYATLEQNIRRLQGLAPAEYDRLRRNCQHVARRKFSFEAQMERYLQFIKTPL